MSEVQASQGRIRLYACGGLGLNIGQANEAIRAKTQPGMASLEISYIDTSKSNLRRAVDPKYCYIFDGMDGSGQKRDENHEKIAEYVPDILQKHKPLDLNIVLHSAAGGSGSVIGPILASQLIARGQNVVVIMVGALDTTKFIQNTIGTIKTYASIAKERKEPVVAVYFENNEEKSPRKAVDEVIGLTLGSLAVLFSRQNEEMDSRDLYNWLHFSNGSLTSYGPRLAALSLVTHQTAPQELERVISVATLATESSGHSLSGMPDYQTVGYLPANAPAEIASNTPVHFVISDGYFNDVTARYTGILREINDRNDARVETDNILSKDDKVASTGIVF